MREERDESFYLFVKAHGFYRRNNTSLSGFTIRALLYCIYRNIFKDGISQTYYLFIIFLYFLYAT